MTIDEFLAKHAEYKHPIQFDWNRPTEHWSQDQWRAYAIANNWGQVPYMGEFIETESETYSMGTVDAN